MCELATLALTVGATLFQGYSAKQQGDYEASVARNNAEIATRKARDTEVQGQHERDQIRLASSRDQARGELAYAGGNVQLGSGSSSDWEADLSRSLEVDLNTSRDNAQRRVDGFNDDRSNYLTEANSAKASGRNALVGAGLSAGGSILGFASKTKKPKTAGGK